MTIESVSLDAKRSARIRVLPDGRPGNVNPAMGLAEEVAAVRSDVQIEQKLLEPISPLMRLPPRFAEIACSLLGAGSHRWPAKGFKDGPARLAPPYPTLAIGCGRLSAPVTAMLRFLSDGQTRAVQLLNPQMPLNRFDLIVAPRHDRLSGGNVLETTGWLSRRRADVVGSDNSALDRLPRPLLSVLIGGASKSARFESSDAEALLAQLRTFQQKGWGIAATLSNRTPADLGARLRDGLTELGGWVWDGTGENPYPSLLSQASALVVTADSVNMASEACATGQPVYIAPVSRLSPKLTRFHAALRQGDHARPLDEASTAAWRPVKLDDMPRAAAAVARLIA
ncbi:MAG: mitochondrial fission ELM1 family protein [Neomegalonema sp.]